MPIKQYRASIVRVEVTEDAYGHVIRKPIGERKGYKATLPNLLKRLMADIAAERLTVEHDLTIVPAYRKMPWEVGEDANDEEDN